MLLGLLDTVARKRFLLLLTRHVEEEFEYQGAVAREVVLERANVLVALPPDPFGHQLGRQLLAVQDRLVDADD